MPGTQGLPRSSERAAMQKHELGERLRHLDPGSTCTVESEQLARIFDAETLTREVVERARSDLPLLREGRRVLKPFTRRGMSKAFPALCLRSETS